MKRIINDSLLVDSNMKGLYSKTVAGIAGIATALTLGACNDSQIKKVGEYNPQEVLTHVRAVDEEINRDFSIQMKNGKDIRTAAQLDLYFVNPEISTADLENLLQNYDGGKVPRRISFHYESDRELRNNPYSALESAANIQEEVYGSFLGARPPVEYDIDDVMILPTFKKDGSPDGSLVYNLQDKKR